MPSPVPNPVGEADESAEQPRPRPAIVDPRANLVEPVSTGLDLAGYPGQRPPQHLLYVVALR